MQHPEEIGSGQDNPLEALRFRWPWRDYQARILNAFEEHADDDRIHVVAAPGSGKTVLGLEIIRRIGRRALILSPTRIVRDQWIERLSDFGAAPTPWTSTSLDAPGFVTSITYQALHTRHRANKDKPPDRRESEEIAAILRKRGVGVLVLDEAHHLRRAWWRALSRIIDQLDDLTVVSLTATPPYDSIGTEWARYEELCGPIDEEISVPELVKSGTLSPHQDYVWAVRPNDKESAALGDYEATVDRTTADLLQSVEILTAVEEHPWMTQPDPESVYEDPELAAAMLVYLKARERPLPTPLLQLLNVRPSELPPLDRRWWQVLIEHYIYGATWKPSPARESHREELKKALRASGLLWRRELRLRGSRPAKRLLTLSESKIDACVRISELERRLRGERLRQVILCDFVRAYERERLGAYPIFARLAEQADGDDIAHIALLTGRLAVLHRSCLPLLQALAVEIEAEPLDDLPDFCRVEVRKGSRVALFTRLLKNGDIRILVGTRALLGEGWDAPSVNSLILASYAGSFVTTNQMRGRAIRTDPNDPKKVASIWHLVSLEADTEAGLADWSGLERRFRAFVGLSESDHTIRSGLGRLALPAPPTSVDRLKDIARARIADIDALGKRWREAIQAGTHGFVVPAVRVRKPPARPRYFFWATLRYLLYAAAGAAGVAFTTILDAAGQARLASEAPRLVLGVAGAAAVIVSLPKLVHAGRAFVRAVPVDGVIRQVAYAVFEALLETGIVTSELDFFDVDVREVAPGVHAASLSGGTFREQSIFADCMDEVLAPVVNPRYIITRRGRGFGRRTDYHAVPMPLAVNKERATCFLKKWERRMGPAELIYTRTLEGRAALLKARSRSFSSAFVPRSERLDRWQ